MCPAVFIGWGPCNSPITPHLGPYTRGAIGQLRYMTSPCNPLLTCLIFKILCSIINKIHKLHLRYTLPHTHKHLSYCTLHTPFPIYYHPEGYTIWCLRFILCIPQCKEIWIYVFPEKELRGLSPNFHIHVSVSDLYIPTIGPPIIFQKNKQTDQGNIQYK